MKQRSNIQLLARHYLSLVISLVLAWSIAYLVILNTHYIVEPFIVWIKGTINQLLLSSYAILLISPFYLFCRQSWVSKTTLLLFGVIAIFEMVSSFYFTITLQPIDNTLLQFNWSQMEMIAGDFVVFKWYYVLLLFPPFIYWFVFRLTRHLEKSATWIITIWFLSIIISLFAGIQISTEKNIYGDLSKNKTYFLLSSLLTEPQTENISIQEAISIYHNNEDKEFLGVEYPLTHENTDQNSLSPFFNLRENEPPNIVFLIVESLSSSFSGKNADEISYTPFLDSLGEHSLYFENALATGERTFAVLPSVLGALPHGKKGFTHERNGYPESSSLLKWLVQNNYQSSFYYGGNARFDYMDLFLNDQAIHNIYDHKNYKKEGIVKQEGVAPAPFGNSDKQLLNNLVNSRTQTSSSPYIDIALTLSMHYPFIVEDQHIYKEKVKQIQRESIASQEVKEKHRKYIKAFSTVLYTDDMLRTYFAHRKSHNDHSNTIYIILGDHMMTDIPHKSSLEKYRSPLLIYSPLLKRSKRILAVNSHLDIAPSFYQLLNNKYNGFESLDNLQWLGSTMDTLSTFRNRRSILFMRNDRAYRDFLHKDKFISEDVLYDVGPRLSIEKLNTTNAAEQIKSLKQAYQKVHTYTVSMNKIKPVPSGKRLLKRKNIAVSISDSTEYLSVLDLKLSEDFQRVSIEVDLSLLDGWKNTDLDLDETQPLLILSVSRNDESYLWRTLDLELSNLAINKPRMIITTIKNNAEFQLKSGDEISIYFWNKEKDGRVFSTVIHKAEVNGVE